MLFEHADAHRLVVSPPVLDEYMDVLRRPELRRTTYRQVAARDLKAVLDWLATAVHVQPAAIAAICRDPEDDKFLATAAAGDASFIVTEDADLLSLGGYEGIRIVTAAQFLEVLIGMEEAEEPE